MGCEIHQCPGAPAKRPRLVLGRTLEARAGLGGARGVEEDPERLGETGRLRQPPALVTFELFEQRRLSPRQPLALGREDEPLQMDFGNTDLLREPDKSR